MKSRATIATPTQSKTTEEENGSTTPQITRQANDLIRQTKYIQLPLSGVLGGLWNNNL